MQFMSLVKFFLICPILFCAQAIYAQTDSSSYIVTYLEVDPITIEESIELLGQISELSSDLQENIFYIVLQRIGRPNHFAIIERWDSLLPQPTEREIKEEYIRQETIAECVKFLKK